MTVRKILFSLVHLILLSMPALAQDAVLETDWLQPSVGSSGQRLDAEVKSVTHPETGGNTIIDISLPLQDAERYDDIEIISRDGEAPLQQYRPHDWIEGYEKGHYGLRLYLKRNPRIGFRVRLIADDEDKDLKK